MKLLRSLKAIWASEEQTTNASISASDPCESPSIPSLQTRILLAESLDRRRRQEYTDVKRIMDRSDLSGACVFFETQWLDKWNEFLKGGPPPGRIAFSALLAKDGEVREDAQLERDYRVIPREIWTYLEAIYTSETPLEGESEEIWSASLPGAVPESQRTAGKPQAKKSPDTSAPAESVKPQQKGLVGIHNPHLFCYLNASVQFLMSVESFRDFLREKSYGGTASTASMYEALSEAAVALYTHDSCPIKPFRLWAIAQRKFPPRKMNDAQEFLHYVLDTLDVELAGRDGGVPARDGLRSELVSGCFAGVMKSEVRCLGCSAENCVREHFLELSLPLSKSVKSALKAFSAKETLERAYDCSNCGTRTDMSKSIAIESCPVYLILSLKRFKQSPSPQKSSAVVKFHKRLLLSQYFLPSSSAEYKLYAVIEHRGAQLESGHYVAFCRRGHLWFLFDDQRVTQVALRDVLSAQAFVLLYRKL